MSFRPNHRQHLPQPCAEASVRAWLQIMQQGETHPRVRRSAAVDSFTSDPGGGVVT